MWRMPGGDRVLTDPEWELFAAGLAPLRDEIDDDISGGTDDARTGIGVFDRLTPEQKLALLADTASALRDPAVPSAPHTAANEGAIAAVLSMVRIGLEMELDFAGMKVEEEKPTEIRRLLWAVCDDAGRRDEPLPEVTSVERDEWDLLLEEFEGRILWDADYELGDEFLDLPREEARERLQFFRIDPDYYLVEPDEPAEAGLIAARQTLARLLGLPVPDEDGLYPALDDLYHGLVVGPCSPTEAGAWQESPWVRVVGLTEPGCDCDYATWTVSLSRAVPPHPFELAPPSAGIGPEPPGQVTIERCDDAWVVRDEDGSYWCDLIENGWAAAPADGGTPALTFPTEAAARSGFAQADRMYRERERRRENALAKIRVAGR